MATRPAIEYPTPGPDTPHASDNAKKPSDGNGENISRPQSENGEADDRLDDVQRRLRNLQGELNSILKECEYQEYPPLSVTKLYQTAYTVIPDIWLKDGPTQRQDEEIHRMNEAIKNKNAEEGRNPETYLFPWEQVRSHIIATSNEWKRLSSIGDGEEREKAWKGLKGEIYTTLSKLDALGIVYNKLLPPNLRHHVELLKKDQSEDLAIIRDMFTKPTPSQRLILYKAMEPCNGFFSYLLDNADIPKASYCLQKVRKLNTQLKSNNENEGLPSSDKALPTSEMEKLLDEFMECHSSENPLVKGARQSANNASAASNALVRSNPNTSVVPTNKQTTESSLNLDRVPPFDPMEGIMQQPVLGISSGESPGVIDLTGPAQGLIGNGEPSSTFEEPFGNDSTPEDVLEIYQPAFSLVKSWWTTETAPDYQIVNDVNEKVKARNRQVINRPPPISLDTDSGIPLIESQFLFPAKFFKEHVDALRPAYHNAMAENTSEALMKFVGETKGFRNELISYDIPFKCVFPDAIIHRILRTAPPEGSELSKIRDDIIEFHPEQRQYLDHYGEGFFEFWKNMLYPGEGRHDNNTCLRLLKSYNSVLDAINLRLSFPIDDHKIPVEKLELLDRMSDDRKAIEILDDLSNYFASQGFPQAWQDRPRNFKQRLERKIAQRAAPKTPNERSDSLPRADPKASSRIPGTGGGDDDDEGTLMIHPRLAEGITLQGKVMFVRNAGRGSHRVFLNAGTERKPFLIVRNGSDFPTGFADEWSRNEEFKSDSWRPKNWKPKSFLCKDYIKTGEGVNGAIKSEEPAKKARAPPSYLYGIEDGKPVIWTKSEFESRCGKKSAERELKNREIHRERRKQILEKARSQGVHPDTNKPLDPCDKEDMPWLFQDSLDIDASMGSTSLSAGQQYTKIISDEDDDDEDELGEDTPTRSSSEPSRGRSANAHANGPTGVSGPKNPTNGANASFSPEQKKELIDMISIAFAQLQNVNKN